MKLVLTLALVVGASAQWGRNRKQEAQTGSLGDLGDEAERMAQHAAAGRPTNDVDLAMAGWEQLGARTERGLRHGRGAP